MDIQVKSNNQGLPNSGQNHSTGQSPYQYLKKEQSSAPGWSWRLFSFSILLLVIASVAYLGIEYGYRQYLNSRISKIDSELEEIAFEIPVEQQESFINFYSQALHIENLLDKHSIISPLFSLLESHVQGNTIFTSIDYDSKENKIALEGISNSFKDLGQQMSRIDSITEIERALISESRSTERGVTFRIILYPKMEILLAKNSQELAENEDTKALITPEETAPEN